jgi:hypothetical protein
MPGDVIFGNATLQETDLASASTCDLGSVSTLRVNITGTTTITSFGTTANRIRHVRFSGALTLTQNATSLILPYGINIITSAGDTCKAESDASGNWRITNYQFASAANERAAIGAASTVSPVFTGTIQQNEATSRAYNLKTRSGVSTYPVPYLKPSGSNLTLAFDLMPNGSPSEVGNHGFAWQDVCGVDLGDSGTDGYAARVGARSVAVEFGSRRFGAGTVKPIYFTIDDGTPWGVIDISGHALFGGATAQSSSGGWVELNKSQNAALGNYVINTNSGTGGLAVFATIAQTAQMFLGSYGDGVTATRYGITKAGYSEIVTTAGNGLLIGNGSVNTPIVFGLNNAEKGRFNNTGLSVTGTITSSGVIKTTGGVIQAFTTSVNSAQILIDGSGYNGLSNAYLSYYLSNASGAAVAFSQIQAIQSDRTAGAEIGSFRFQNVVAGVMTDAGAFVGLQFQALGTADATGPANVTGALICNGGAGFAKSVYIGAKLGLKSYTVAGLPAGAAGDTVFCSNCRVFNGAGTQEGASSGTGGVVTYNGSQWKIAGTNITAVA